MATGLTKREKGARKNAVLIGSQHAAHAELPPENKEVTLCYDGKLSRAEVLNVEPCEVSELTTDGNVRPRETIVANALVACNNYAGLAKLRETAAGKVRLIYTDPPYGTGFGFQSRSLVHAYDDHYDGAQYAEFMRRRIILCHELLADDGSLYMHIGYQMVAELKLILDEVFGRSNFRNLIARRKCSSKNSTKKSFPNLLDFVLFYTKSNNYVFNQPTQKADDDWLEKEYPKCDRKGRYKLVPIHAPGERNGATGLKWRGMSPPPGKHWQYTPDKLDAIDAAGEMHWSKNGNPRRKVYLEADKGVPLTDYWSGYRDAHHQSTQITGYPTEKNLDMVKMLVAAGSNRGDLVLDPFCGSGTTLHAADDLHRHWIGMDNSLSAIETSLIRLNHGLSKMGDYVLQPNAPRQDLFARKARNYRLLVDNEVMTTQAEEIERIASATRSNQRSNMA